MAGPALLHHGARRASVAQERQRARDIVSHAKTLVAETFEQGRFGRSLNVDRLWPLVSGINASIARHPTAILGVMRLQERHEPTYLHSIAVCGLMIGLARRMGIDPTLHHDIGLAGLLHDIGKAKLPTTILEASGPLSDNDQSVMRNHCIWGYEMLVGKEEPLPPLVLDVCLHHHEHIDGRGYPDQKTGESISVYARMAAICDAYDNLTSGRGMIPGCSPAEAIEMLLTQPGAFDSAIVSAFSGMLGVFPAGALVRLQSNRLAVVLEGPEGDPYKPPVCPFFCVQGKRALDFRVTDSALDPILGVELPGRWPMIDWVATRRAVLRWLDGEEAAA